MIKNNKRALAYIVTIDSITEIVGADNIVLAHVGGWNVIIKKNEFKENDLAVFFEIDSKLPETEWSEFLRKKHFIIKTMKLSKFNVISQGLLLPMSILPEGNFNLGDDVTDVLGVKYSVAEDNERKSNKSNPDEKYNRMARRHPKLAKKKWFRWLMKREWGKNLLFVLFGKRKDIPKNFPEWIIKTDEERCENKKWELENKEPLIQTEKIDGTSTTFFLDTIKRDFGVCSRNVRQTDIDQKNYHSNTGENVYWEMCFKYDIENKIKLLAEELNAKRIVIQGETYGDGIQGNPYKLNERKFAAFNLIIDGTRMNSIIAKRTLNKYDIPFVPIINRLYVMPDDFEEFKLSADGISTINMECKREGFVYRGYDGIRSFKNVSREYLLKKGE